MAGRSRDPRKTKGKKPLSNGWVVVPSKTYPDRVYFYNTVTRCSTWNNPCEDRSDEESNNSSSETNLAFRTKQKSVITSTKKHKSTTGLNSGDRSSNIRINNEIEDYDDHDQYFSEIHINTYKNKSTHMFSPPSSPDSVSSSKTNISDSDNQFLESNKKQLWAHFVPSPDKMKVKTKSVALSDFQEASTSKTPVMVNINESDKNNIKNFLRNKKRKRKKKQTENEKEITVEKINKNLTFKKSSKTTAQARLLKLRKQNAEKLKELATKYPELGIDVHRHSKSSKNSNSYDAKIQTENTSFSDNVLTQTTGFNGPEHDTDNHFGVDYCEEMDWEPYSEESDVLNINVFRQLINKHNEASGENFVGLNLDSISALTSKTHSWFLVLDTNIFVSCLPFVKELRDTKVTGLGYPVIYVPWRVLQELDHLKDSKLDSVNRNLLLNVRRAIGYLNENFKSRHPRIFGQSFEDFAKMIDVSTSQFAPDDEILQTCIQLQKLHGDKKLMLLTNDKNLESKAIISGIEVYSKDRFQKKYLKPSSPPSQFISSTLNKSNNEGADECFCQVKAILKDFLSMVVETEMKHAFEGDWIKVAVKKPPWSLQDVIKCLLKHWRSVFFLNFSKDIHSEVELLQEQLFKRETVNTQNVAEIIKTTQQLLISIKKSQKKRRTYLDLIPEIMSKLCDLLKMILPNQSEESAPSLPLVSVNYCNTQQVSQNLSSSNNVSIVTALFKEIWDSLRSFCCSLSDIIHSSGPNTEVALQEIRLKLSQILNEVKELVATVEKILELNPTDISEYHPVINYFSNFLIRVYPKMVPNLINELPRCLAVFFTDFEGRSLICISLKDFKEFILDLTKASEYFNA